MSRKVQFTELDELLVETGLSVNAMSKCTKVSRNTLAAMQRGQEVSVNSVAKLLNGLKKDLGVDVRKYHAILRDRASIVRTKQMAANGPGNFVVLEGKPARTTALIASELAEYLKSSFAATSELIDSANGGDMTMSQHDAREILRYFNHLNTDFGEIAPLLQKAKHGEGKKP